MQVRTETRGQRVEIAGRLDVSTVAEVRAALHQAIDGGVGDLYVGIAALEVLDVTGLGVLVGAHRRAGRAGRRLVLTEVPPRVERLLAVTRLSRVLHVARAGCAPAA